MSRDMVEAVARAICRAHGCHPDYRLRGGDNLKWTDFDDHARAALNAIATPDTDRVAVLERLREAVENHRGFIRQKPERADDAFRSLIGTLETIIECAALSQPLGSQER